MAIAWAGNSFSQNGTAEYKVKAVFLYNFSQFVEWPASSFGSETDPFIIGVLGQNPFGTTLNDVVSGEKAKGRPISIKYYRNTDEIKSPQILFIAKDQAGSLGDILFRLNGRNIFTVSESANFLSRGGIMWLFTKGSKVGLMINIDAAKSAKLEISSKLLRSAEIYVPK
jgi:hypothetical protein